MKHLPLALGLSVLAGCATMGGPAAIADPTIAVDTHLLLADIAIERRDLETAAKETFAAARISDNPALAERATRVANELGMTQEGIESAQRWLELADNTQGPLFFLGVFELRANRPARSVDAFERFIREYGDPANGLVLVLDALGRESSTDASAAVMKSLTQTFP